MLTYGAQVCAILFVYPIVKKVADILGQKMTKAIFAKAVGKIIPVIGGVISGGLTLVSFKPLAKRLKNYLGGLSLADTDYYKEKSADDNNDYNQTQYS